MKYITISELRSLEARVHIGEISLSKMVEIINEKIDKQIREAYDWGTRTTPIGGSEQDFNTLLETLKKIK